MADSMLQIIKFHRRLLISILLGTFFVLAIIIFLTPKAYVVRSSIEVGSAVIGNKQDWFEPPDQLAKQIASTYSSTALLAMAQNGLSPGTLVALANLKTQPIGRSVVMLSTVDASQENDAKQFQQNILDQVIKERAPHIKALRDYVVAKIASASRTSANFAEQIKAITDQIESSGARSSDLRKQAEISRAALAAKFQNLGTLQNSDERSAAEAAIRELREQIRGLESSGNDLATERSDLIRRLAEATRQNEEQLKAIDNARNEQRLLTETRVSLPPSLIPIPTGPRRLLLLVAALAVSLLLAFGTAVLLVKLEERKI
jgi:hypothetical protein